MRPRAILLTALAVSLLAAAPASAGGLVQLDGPVLRFTADDLEPSNVTIDDVGGVLTLDDDASRMTVALGSACTLDATGYHVTCPDAGIERIEVQLGLLGSDVRIRADLPSTIRGGPGDDLLVGGPAEDVIDGGGGQDIIAGGGGADVLSGGPGEDLVTYVDRIAPDGTLLPRRTAVRAQIGRLDWSGSGDERDTIERDVEQLQGGAGNDRFSLRDGRATEVACGGGRDTVTADPRDVVDIDCERASVAPPRGGTRLTVATLPFPFPSVNDRARGTIAVEPLLPLHGGAIPLRVSCPAGLGLLELVRSDPCTGRVRFTRGDGAPMGTQRVRIPRGGTIGLRLPLRSSRALARRAAGLPVVATALPSRGHVVRSLIFRVRG
ncbi:MAG: calcium-binding protein [Actinobacteria bacterium]|nr:calcium-binding protein [Actinomycetota bacterium]